MSSLRTLLVYIAGIYTGMKDSKPKKRKQNAKPAKRSENKGESHTHLADMNSELANLEPPPECVVPQ
jgi:hypothetical protein